MDTDTVARLLRANNLALSLDAIRRHDYPIAFHLLHATYSMDLADREPAGYYLGMGERQAELFRTAVNTAWRQELSQLTNLDIERMTADGTPLSELGSYLRQSGLPCAVPGMSHSDLLFQLIKVNDDEGIWQYLPADRLGPRQFSPELVREPDELIVNITKRSRPVLLWSTQVTLQPTATSGELFGRATIQINFGRRTQIHQRKGAILLDHVNLRCTVDGYAQDEQPTGESVLDQTVEVSLLTSQISLSA